MNTIQVRRELSEPGPMIPPVPAVLTSVKGAEGGPDEISVLWTFVVSGKPPQIGVSASKTEHVVGRLLTLHREFVLNVVTAEHIRAFDVVDMNSSKEVDKFALSGFTKGQAQHIDAPTVEEAGIQLECKMAHIADISSDRSLFIADVVATSVQEGVCDPDGRLIVDSLPIFGMTAGSGEFYTMGQHVGHIGMTVGRTDIRY